MKILSYASTNSDLSTGFVYQWTNNVNGMKYIGSHKGNNPNYFASGKLIIRALEKYGRESFTREILYVGPRFREVEDEMLLAIDAKQRDNGYYNLVNFSPPSQQPGEIRFAGEQNPMFGRKHSAETRAKMSKAHAPREYPWLIGMPRPLESKKKTSATMLIRWHDKDKHAMPREGCPKCTTVE